MDTNKLVNTKLQELIEVFNEFSSCTIEPNRGERLLIASNKPVQWASKLKKQYGESEYKIGYIDPKKTCLGLYIDFPQGFLNFDEVSKVVNPDNCLLYAPPEQKAPTSKSWWRFRTEDFDSIHMVIRNNELHSYTFKKIEWIELLRKIVDVHK